MFFINNFKEEEVRGGVLPYNRLMGICHWMGSYFDYWIDYNGVVPSKELLLEWSSTFSTFGHKKFLASRDLNY